MTSAVDRPPLRPADAMAVEDRAVARRAFASKAAIAALLAAGVGLRVYALISYAPAVLTAQAHDAADYVEAARLTLSRGAQEPLGYPLFLRLLHSISHELVFTIAVQHALGLAAGGLLFLTVRRLGAPTWVALVPAAVLWLNGDELFLEHALLSETLFTFALAAMVYAAVRAVEGGWRWPLIAGALAAVPLTVRTVAQPLPLVVLIWMALALTRARLPWRQPLALTLAAAVAVVCVYGLGHSVALQRVSIFPDGAGWNLYARAAEFANCHDFKPPRGTSALCDPTPLSRRQGPGYYLYFGGPAHVAFGEPAAHDHLLLEFALTAIVHQPLDYLSLVGTDAVMYVDPSFGRVRIGGFATPSALAFPDATPVSDPQTLQEVRAYYGPVRTPTSAVARGLHDYQQIFRVTGTMLLAMLILAAIGAINAPPRVRWAMVLMIAVALELILVPTLAVASWRFAVPAEGTLSAAAALGIWSLAPRLAGIARWAIGYRAFH